ncbi:metallophosphoesterase [Microbacterium sp. Marseille-Q6965]|uniref:metallophosphoesterase n=1 Tax=Microbacterium sp. Marseille-Q6965 TaxID=2965072 RepID=UPI0021B7FEE6|nr:metallophosphoesterase [Microbacterium sp. Marseille-Q6965]
MSSRAARGALAVLGAGAAAGAAAAIWGIGIERHLYTVRHHVVRVLSPGARPIRVLHLSDAHMAPWQHRKQEWIARLAALRPDLVINTGDNLGHPEGLRGIREAFEPLAGVPGVFVHGSNDLYAPKPKNPLKYLAGPSRRHGTPTRLDTAALDAYLSEELGWERIDNTAVRMTVAGSHLRLAGTDDAHHGSDRADETIAALASLESGDLTIGVTHAPYRRVLDALTGAGADMLFAGHTHGGQVRVPFVGALVGNCDLPLSQVRGLSAWTHGERSVPLNVSAGLGHSIYAPVRFACRPEASLITLAPRH